jgi:hypothetical protein
VAEHQGVRQPGIADARFFVPVQIRATQPNGGHSEEDLTRTGRRDRLS